MLINYRLIIQSRRLCSENNFVSCGSRCYTCLEINASLFFNDEKSRDKLSLRPHRGKSVAYRLQNAPFVFTRQRVDVTDVLSALSYDGLLDVRVVRHSVSGRCRATRIWNDCLVRERQKTRIWRVLFIALACLMTLPHDFSLQPHANAMAILFKTIFSSCCSSIKDTSNVLILMMRGSK